MDELYSELIKSLIGNMDRLNLDSDFLGTLAELFSFFLTVILCSVRVWNPQRSMRQNWTNDLKHLQTVSTNLKILKTLKTRCHPCWLLGPFA